MEQSCFIHTHESAAHECSQCGHGYCVDCLHIVDHQAVCRNCIHRFRVPSENEAIASILISSIVAAIAVALNSSEFINFIQTIWG